MSRLSEGTLQRAIAFVAALGLGVAAYIAIADANSGSPVCLGGGSGCETVARSSWSHLAGVDVAVFGVIGYALYKIEAACQWCLASAILMTILFGLCAARLIVFAGAPEARPERA
jgi:uncharacterized membrane protein